MYFVKDIRHGATFLVFTGDDPRKAGYKGNVIEGVTLDFDMDAVYSWPDGHDSPDACLGRDPDNPNHYKVFKYRSELQSAGYQPIPGMFLPIGFWDGYLKLQRLPPDPDQTDDEPWYDYLDKLDEDSRRRRQRVQAPAAPMGKSRDDVAAWLAKKHFFADSGIREVWYLPREAPPEEIRLLELNDRLAGAESKAEAIDFGLDVEGSQFRLFVADITSEQLEQIKKDPSRLPSGWSLADSRIWRRGA